MVVFFKHILSDGVDAEKVYPFFQDFPQFKKIQKNSKKNSKKKSKQIRMKFKKFEKSIKQHIKINVSHITTIVSRNYVI